MPNNYFFKIMKCFKDVLKTLNYNKIWIIILKNNFKKVHKVFEMLIFDFRDDKE